jgi:hypothetical protein
MISMKASATAGDRSWQAEDDYDHPKVPISDVGMGELPPLIQQQQWLSFFDSLLSTFLSTTKHCHQALHRSIV